MSKILVIRLSAIGDVAMTIPVIYSAAEANPNDTFTVLTQTFLIPVFMNMPANVEVLSINTKGTEKKIIGLIRFAWVISCMDYDIILDLHNVLRTRILRSFCKLKGKRVYVIDKFRKEKRKLIRKKNKVLKPIKPVTDRYADVFKKANLNYESKFNSLFNNYQSDLSSLSSLINKKRGKWIGIAPFSKHKGKVYPLNYMEDIIAYLSKKENISVFIFGAKGEEQQIVEHWVNSFPMVKSLIGQYSLDAELGLLSKLDLLISMDSANMHFASLVKTRVLSIWGATHPYAGFYGYKQDYKDALQVELYCRPCSIYGNKPCYRGDWSCMNRLKPEQVINAINQILDDKNSN